MLFKSNRERVEEDLEKIRRANQSPQAAEKEVRPQSDETEEKVQITHKDIVAMNIAAFEVLLPYFLVIAGVSALIYWLVVSLAK